MLLRHCGAFPGFLTVLHGYTLQQDTLAILNLTRCRQRVATTALPDSRNPTSMAYGAEVEVTTRELSFNHPARSGTTALLLPLCRVP